ncbi:hypothetical protein BJ741DRAFT_705818 [Chytriomyces cf. hyalinus JEL632]|nr:hypothetical protein BJ741DRAFT_705818 [Chytriomyces cf. hyalinus JEL632]
MEQQPDLGAALDEFKKLLVCPYSWEVFDDPVVSADGVTYERKSAVGWEEAQKAHKRMMDERRGVGINHYYHIYGNMNAQLSVPTQPVYPNLTMRKIVEAFNNLETVIQAQNEKMEENTRRIAELETRVRSLAAASRFGRKK